MTDQIRQTVLRLLAEIAPEADPADIRGDIPLRDQLDLDSMDFLNLVVAVDEALGIAIPEDDYGSLTTLDAMVAYVAGLEPRDPTQASGR